jgi:hypothetical protein
MVASLDSAGCVEGAGGAEELGDVGGHRHHLGLRPHAPADRPGESLADQFGQIAVGDNAQLGRLPGST